MSQRSLIELVIGCDLESILARLSTNRRDKVFFASLTVLLVIFNIILTDGIIRRLQFWLFNAVLVYIAYKVTPFFYDSLYFIEKPNIDPSGKSVFITGCDSGFGLRLAKKLASKGYYIFAGCLSVNSDGAQELRSNFRSDDQVQVIPLDVTNDESVAQCRAMIDEKLATYNAKYRKTKPALSLWAVVNNAGIMELLEIDFGDIGTFKRQMEVNCLGTVRVTKSVLPLLRRNKIGNSRIVNVASLAGRFTMPGFVGYCMSKGAIISFSDGLRRELAKWNIDVVCIEPHLFRTTLLDRERLARYYDNAWQQTSAETKEDYGEYYFDRFKDTMETCLTTARESVDQVVDTFENAVIRETVEPSYQVMRHIEKIRVWAWETIVPTPVTDYLMRTLLTEPNGIPARLDKQ